MGTIRKVKIRSCGNYTFKELFDIFKLEKRAYGISEKTIRNYFETLNKFCKELDLQNPQINQITKEDIYYFINQLNDNGSRVATINHYLRELKAFFHWAYDSGYLNEKIDIKDEKSLIEMTKNTKIEIINERIYLDGVDVSETIRGIEVTNNVSTVCSYAGIREEI